MFITNLGKDDVLLGTDWLKYHDPSIGWKQHEVHFDRCPRNCQQPHGFTKAWEEPSPRDWLQRLQGEHIEQWKKPQLVPQPVATPQWLSKEEWRQLPSTEFRAQLFAILDDPNWGKQHAEHRKRRYLAKERLKALIAERGNSQRTWCRKVEPVILYHLEEREQHLDSAERKQCRKGNPEERKQHLDSIERKQHHEDAPKAYATADDFEEREQYLKEQDTVIRKVAPEPSGLTSFDKDLEEEIDMTNLKERVPKAHYAYLNIFSKQRSWRLPKHSLWDHTIDLKPMFKPQAPKIYALSPEKHDELGKFIKEHLARGTIQRSTSHSATPFFFVGKKDGKL